MPGGDQGVVETDAGGGPDGAQDPAVLVQGVGGDVDGGGQWVAQPVGGQQGDHAGGHVVAGRPALGGDDLRAVDVRQADLGAVGDVPAQVEIGFDGVAVDHADDGGRNGPGRHGQGLSVVGG